MGKMHDAKNMALKVYPNDRYLGVNLFLDQLDVGLDDFEHEEAISPEEYIYGKTTIMFHKPHKILKEG